MGNKRLLETAFFSFRETKTHAVNYQLVLGRPGCCNTCPVPRPRPRPPRPPAPGCAGALAGGRLAGSLNVGSVPSCAPESASFSPIGSSHVGHLAIVSFAASSRTFGCKLSSAAFLALVCAAAHHTEAFCTLMAAREAHLARPLHADLTVLCHLQLCGRRFNRIRLQNLLELLERLAKRHPILAVFLRQARHHLRKSRHNIGWPFARRRVGHAWSLPSIRLVWMLEHVAAFALQAHGRLRDERHEYCDAKCVAVRERRVLQTVHHERIHESGRAGDVARRHVRLKRRAPLLCQADIGEARVAILVEKHIGRLDVAV